MRGTPYARMAVAAMVLGGPANAWAGGFEFPTNGTEALGRGGAFVAKADDGSAMEYNIAGLASQEGFRLTIDANTIIHDFSFTSAGFVQSDQMTGTRMPVSGAAGMPGPTMHDSDRLFFAPMAAASFDLGRLSRKLKNLVIGLGVFGPSSVGNHNYGVGDPITDKNNPNNTCHQAADVNGAPYQTCDDQPATTTGSPTGMPAPSRYDIAKTNLLIVLPTLGIAYRPHPMIDIGLGWQMVFDSFDLSNANVVSGVQGNNDAYGRIRTSGNSFSSSSSQIHSSDYQFKPGLGSFGWMLSVMLHPTNWIDIGATYRTPITVHSEGTLHPISPPSFPKVLPDSAATFTSTLPMWLRAGARVVKRYSDGTERADLELDFVWENWASEQADHVHAEDLTGQNFLWPTGTLDADIIHTYRDTYGVRLGGAYNYRLSDTRRLIGRLGMFYDSSSTVSHNTRLDFNTFDKLGLTVGGGFKMKGFTLNFAYAYIYTPTRTVDDSTTYAISAGSGSTISPGQQVYYVGNGVYSGYMHIVSVGLTFNFSEFKAAGLFPD